MVADLVVGFRYFLQFAADAGAISMDEATQLGADCDRSLYDAARTQAAYQVANDTAAQFLNLLAAAIASGRAHVATRDGKPPEDASAWGWRGESFAYDPTPQGSRIGWLDGEELYLESAAALAAVKEMSRDHPAVLSLSLETLSRRLKDSGLLASTEPGRRSLTVRRVVERRRMSVLHLHARSVRGCSDADQSDQS